MFRNRKKLPGPKRRPSPLEYNKFVPVVTPFASCLQPHQVSSEWRSFTIRESRNSAAMSQSQSPQHRRKSNKTALLFTEIDALLARPHPPFHPRDLNASPEPDYYDDDEPMVGKKSGRALLREEGMARALCGLADRVC
jgi:hypothetical protein